MSCALTRLHDEGVSISGNLRELIARSFTEGVTTSPTIFVPALGRGDHYCSPSDRQYEIENDKTDHVDTNEVAALTRIR